MLPLAAKTAAQEGLDVIKAMLVVGLIFLERDRAGRARALAPPPPPLA